MRAMLCPRCRVVALVIVFVVDDLPLFFASQRCGPKTAGVMLLGQCWTPPLLVLVMNGVVQAGG